MDIQRNVVISWGFKNPADLARQAKMNPSNLSRILRGEINLSHKAARQLTEAIYQRNKYANAWSYWQVIVSLYEGINYSRSHYAHHNKSDLPEWLDIANAERLHSEFFHILPSQEAYQVINLNFRDRGLTLSEELVEILSFVKEWSMKHDFDYTDKLEHMFKSNFCTIDQCLGEALKQDLFDEVLAIFTEIRHVAHLCGAFPLVEKLARWLITQSNFRKEPLASLKAKVSLAWTLTSRREEGALLEANQIVQEIFESSHMCFSHVDASDLDVIAILAELNLRIPIRMFQTGLASLDQEEFSMFFSQSKNLLEEELVRNPVDLRFIYRYRIPLQYQTGVFWFQKGRLDQSEMIFQEVANQSNLIGWQRVEQGAYLWLASIKKETDPGSTQFYLSKVKGNCRKKKLLRKEEIQREILPEV